jgi:hypothetical protein
VSYRILRKIREWPLLWQDPEGRSPDQVSSAPVAPVALVNTPHESAVYAFADVESASTTSLAASFIFSRELSRDENPNDLNNTFLPQGLLWRVEHIAYGASAASDVRVDLLEPNLAGVLQVGANGLPSTGGIATIQVKWLGAQQGTVPPTTGTHFWMPYGGQFRIIGGAAAARRLCVVATGFLRGSIVGP